MDNYGTHKHPSAGLAEAPSPLWSALCADQSSWLNLVERWFRELTSKRSAAVRSPARGPENGHREFLAAWNESPTLRLDGNRRFHPANSRGAGRPSNRFSPVYLPSNPEEERCWSSYSVDTTLVCCCLSSVLGIVKELVCERHGADGPETRSLLPHESVVARQERRLPVKPAGAGNLGNQENAAGLRGGTKPYSEPAGQLPRNCGLSDLR